MMKVITKIIWILVLISCNSEKKERDTFTISKSIDKTNFIPSPQNNRIFKVKINDSAYLKLPHTDEYNWTIKDAYRINNNWINNDTIYVENFHNNAHKKNGKRKNLSLLKIKKSLDYQVYDSIGFDSIDIDHIYLNPHQTEILTLENNSKKTMVRIFKNKELKSIDEFR